jgi:3-hydroxyisobutyrate dehydrogenase-like beta-hydroxyacid dehydrogenase
MKDLNAVLQMAAEAGSPVFGGALAQQLYRSIRATGEEVGRLDYSVVARIFEEVNGVDLRLPEK